MRKYLEERVLDLGSFIVEQGATVRQTATRFGISKSTVHKDITERLPKINQSLAKEVKRVLEKNKAERHIRGGEATRRRYQTKLKKEKKQNERLRQPA